VPVALAARDCDNHGPSHESPAPGGLLELVLMLVLRVSSSLKSESRAAAAGDGNRPRAQGPPVPGSD
jgi:hypothetical protein